MSHVYSDTRAYLKHPGDSVNLCKLAPSLFNDAEFPQGQLGMRDDLRPSTDASRGKGGRERSRVAIICTQRSPDVVFFLPLSLGLSSSASNYSALCLPVAACG